MTESSSLTATALVRGLELATVGSWSLFQNALADPARAQQRRLHAVVDAVRGTRTAARFSGLTRVRTARDFQDAIPLRTYDDLSADVDDAVRGVPRVLTRAPPLRFERTGGSGGAHKRVPYTAAQSREVHRALLPWMHDVLRRRPALREGSFYASISPLARADDCANGGVPTASDDDKAYFPAPIAALLSRVLAVPDDVARLPSVDICRYATLRLLLARADLRFISVWSPSFLSLLLATLDEHGERLLDDLARGTCTPPGADDEALRACARLPLVAAPERARTLRAHLSTSGALTPQMAWPHLALISLWTDAHAARALVDVERRFSGVEIQGKGLLATEGVVTVPVLDAPAPVLAVRSHFYEFIDPRHPERRPKLAHELDDGATYEVVISTSGGFLRYRLGDLVRVEGFMTETPCLRFMGRADDVSDLVGEKLSAPHARAAIDKALNGLSCAFAMMAPEWEPTPGYALFVEGALSARDLDLAAARAEHALLEGFHYRYARELGQLRPLRAVRVTDGARAFEERRTARGQRAGDIKPADLDKETGWHETFTCISGSRP